MQLLPAVALTAIPLIGQGGRWWAWADTLNAFLGPTAILLALIALHGFARRQWTAVTVATIGAALALIQLGSGVLRASPRQDGATDTVRVLTVSAYHANPHPFVLRDMISKLDPDLAFIQEADGAAAEALAQALPGHHRVLSCPAARCSLVIVSRWPLARSDRPDLHAHDLPDLLAAEVSAPFARFRVVTLHLPRMLSPQAERHRGMLVDLVRSGNRLPTIAGGDFNLATGSFALSALERQSGLRRLDRYVPSYPANLFFPAVVPIDHVLSDGHWDSLGCRGLSVAGSDHRAVLCRLRLRP
ncbi:endonuclease/exonuclease/phosphatase family protein [Novosphingobium mangrovi (ex Huang et al. 2023)]|uniref:endonuclease/exonuclease/phosphatase family protein n=1 Tax=Novosphingobium mangrovi (ex Huang et al. 2023) TaxID=2976432 RepID=UPI0021A57F34|nr:endonuclease/exonuclease/phosphatase family protein [Novosphingobium mangrovi (ex Huang et al. 2023)]